MNSEKIKVLALVGATASGKTSLAVELAHELNGEIVSADSMQIYEGMDIATAKPSACEMDSIRHHMLSVVPTHERYSVSDYVAEAGRVISDIHARNKLPIIAGGTGLYIDSLLDGIQFFENAEDEKIKEKLLSRLEKDGIDKLYSELLQIDPISAESIHKNNIKRVIRALEVYYSSGITMTEQKKLSRLIDTPYDALYIGLKCNDRQKLYDRINRRVDIMIQSGLIDEAKKVLSMDLGQTAKMAIGYKELAPYFEGIITLDEAVENLKRETRRYAKRQLTWFMRNERINWIDIDTKQGKDDILNAALDICKRGGIIGKKNT